MALLLLYLFMSFSPVYANLDAIIEILQNVTKVLSNTVNNYQKSKLHVQKF